VSEVSEVVDADGVLVGLVAVVVDHVLEVTEENGSSVSIGISAVQPLSKFLPFGRKLVFSDEG